MSENNKKGVYVYRNCICMFSPIGYGEIVLYKETFKIPEKVTGQDPRAHLRKFFRDEDGYWQARTSIDLIKQDLTLRRCGKRATKKIILYAMANKWEQFITLTFDPKMVNRYDEIECKEKWREFERYCKRTYPNCKMLSVWEYHKKTDEFGARALHFHILASGLPFPTVPYLNERGEQQFSKSGVPLFILTPKAWAFGFSTVAYLPEDGSDNVRVVNYLTKYVSKYRAKSGDSVKMCNEVSNYNSQRYYHTRNLDICAQSVLEEIMNEADVYEFARLNGFELHKTNNKMIVFRRFNDGQSHEPITPAEEQSNDISVTENNGFLQIMTSDDVEFKPAPRIKVKRVTNKKIIRKFDLLVSDMNAEDIF